MSRSSGKTGRARADQLGLAFPVPDFGLDDLVRTEANANAIDRLMRWPDWPDTWLSVFGPRRSGLTTLGRAFARRSGAVILSAAGVDALDRAGIEALGKTGAVIDPVEDITSGDHLLSILNRSQEYGQPVLLLSHVPPSDITLGPPDLRSRLRAMDALRLQPPDFAMIVARLRAAFRLRFIVLPDPIAEYLAKRVPPRYAEIEHLVGRLEAAMTGSGRGLSLALAREVLEQGEPTRDLFEDEDGDDNEH